MVLPYPQLLVQNDRDIQHTILLLLLQLPNNKLLLILILYLWYVDLLEHTCVLSLFQGCELILTPRLFWKDRNLNGMRIGVVINQVPFFCYETIMALDSTSLQIIDKVYREPDSNYNTKDQIEQE